jgi:hypothetical protein
MVDQCKDLIRKFCNCQICPTTLGQARLRTALSQNIVTTHGHEAIKELTHRLSQGLHGDQSKAITALLHRTHAEASMRVAAVDPGCSSRESCCVKEGRVDILA